MSPLVKNILREYTGRPFRSILIFGLLLLISATAYGLLALVASIGESGTERGPSNLVWVTARHADHQEEYMQTEIFKIPLDQAELIVSQPGIVRYSREQILMVTMPRTNREDPIDIAIMRGLDPDGVLLHGVRMLVGREPYAGVPEVMVGYLAQQRHPLTIGADFVVFSLFHFKVVGVFRTDTSLDEQVVTSRPSLLSVLGDGAGAGFNSIYLEARDSAQAAQLIERLGNLPQLALNVRNPTHWQAEMMRDELGRLRETVLFVLAMVTMGAGFAMTSLLTMLSVRRMAEMSALRAIGFPMRTIFGLILIERMVLVIGSAVVGVGVAAARLDDSAFLVTGDLNGGVISIPFSSQAAVSTLGLMALVGAASCVLPMLRLRRTEVSEGLRE